MNQRFFKSLLRADVFRLVECPCRTVPLEGWKGGGGCRRVPWKKEGPREP